MQDPLREHSVKEEFKRRRNRQLLIAAPMIAAILLVVWASDHPGEQALSLAGVPATAAAFVAILGGIVFSLMNWRCPACNGYLGKGINPKFCQKCGAKLQD